MATPVHTASSTAEAEFDTLFAMHMPVSSDSQERPESIPDPVPGSGYKAVQLHDPAGDGTYRAKTTAAGGYQVVAFFAAEGVQKTPKGKYPAGAVQLVQPDSRDAIEQAVSSYGPGGSVTIAADYATSLLATSGATNETNHP